MKGSALFFLSKRIYKFDYIQSNDYSLPLAIALSVFIFLFKYKDYTKRLNYCKFFNNFNYTKA